MSNAKRRHRRRHRRAKAWRNLGGTNGFIARMYGASFSDLVGMGINARFLRNLWFPPNDERDAIHDISTRDSPLMNRIVKLGSFET